MSSATIARGTAECKHPKDKPLIWKFNQGNPCYLCPQCRGIVGYSADGRSDMTLAELQRLNRAVV